MGRVLVCVCDGGVCVAAARVYWSCKREQEWATDLTSNESGVLPSEGVSVGEKKTSSWCCIKGAAAVRWSALVYK